MRTIPQILLLQHYLLSHNVIKKTFWLCFDANKQIEIRLEGIDCPESKQDFGTKAKQAVSDLCFVKQVTIINSGEDRYGRTLGFVFVGDVNVNKELIRQGLAWHYKYFNKDEELAKL